MDNTRRRSRPVSGGMTGGLRKVTAIVRSTALEKVEDRLQAVGVPGITVSTVKGFGEYANLIRHDWSVEHARIEIFLRSERADEIARAIIESASTGLAGDGLVVIEPVESIYRIRSGERATSDELGGCRCDPPHEETPEAE